MTTARVTYATGRELLLDYWGYLATGGLVVSAEGLDAVCTGAEVLLEVRVVSLRQEFRIAGHLRARDGGRAVIAFVAGGTQDLMLSAAWADGEDAPQRQHRRWGLKSASTRLRYRGGEGTGQVVNLSRGGCCLESRARLHVGERIRLALAPVSDAWVDAKVRWADGTSGTFGVEFDGLQEQLLTRMVP